MDFGGWGLDGWRYDDMLPYFRRAVPTASTAATAPGTCATCAIRTRCRRRSSRPPSTPGSTRNTDFNGPELDGAGLSQVTQHRGRRFSAADAYLRPARHRRNLEVVTGALVTGVLVRRGRADAVTYRRNGAAHVASGGEIVLCAGAIGSPQLLMLSGIGPAAHLRAHGIEVAADLPGVGQNLQDHVMAPLLWTATRPVSLHAAHSPRQLARYLLRQRGRLPSNAIEAARSTWARTSTASTRGRTRWIRASRGRRARTGCCSSARSRTPASATTRSSGGITRSATSRFPGTFFELPVSRRALR